MHYNWSCDKSVLQLLNLRTCEPATSVRYRLYRGTKRKFEDDTIIICLFQLFLFKVFKSLTDFMGVSLMYKSPNLNSEWTTKNLNSKKCFETFHHAVPSIFNNLSCFLPLKKTLYYLVRHGVCVILLSTVI